MGRTEQQMLQGASPCPGWAGPVWKRLERENDLLDKILDCME